MLLKSYIRVGFMAPLMTMLVIVLSALGTAVASDASEQSFIGEQQTSLAVIKFCVKLDAPRPSRKECNQASSFGSATRRPRSDEQDFAVLATVPDREVLSIDYREPRLAVREMQSKPPWRGSRSPFWALFAHVPKLRN